MSLAKKNQSGVAHVLLVLVFVCLLALVVVVGLRVANRSTTTSNTAAVSSVPTHINSTSDLTQAQKALDDAQLPDPSQLDNDIKNLL